MNENGQWILYLSFTLNVTSEWQNYSMLRNSIKLQIKGYLYVLSFDKIVNYNENNNKIRKIITSTNLLTIMNTLLYETWYNQKAFTNNSNGWYLNNKGWQFSIMNFASCIEWKCYNRGRLESRWITSEPVDSSGSRWYSIMDATPRGSPLFCWI